MKKLLSFIAIFALLFSLAPSALAAVSLGTTGSNTSGSGTSTNFSQLVNTGDSLLIATCGFANADPGTVTASIAGVPLTAQVSNLHVSTHQPYLWVFSLFNPPTGTNTLSFSWSNSTQAGCQAKTFIGAGSLGTPVTNTGTWTVNPTTFSNSATITANDMVMGIWVDDKASGTRTVNQTSLWNFTDTSGFLDFMGNTNTGSGSVTVSIRENVAGNPNNIAYAAIPIIAGTPPTAAVSFGTITFFQ